jgi:hypothetical protein
MAGQDTRTPEVQQKSSSFDGPGPFMAIVRNHIDTEYMGSLEVELLKSTTEGNTTNVSGEMATVNYLSPFYGITPYSGTSDNEGFDHTQKSYGMWAVPPDIGTTVLVIFAEGNKSRGFWIGCVQEKFMNFMIPGNASTTYNKEDQQTVLPVSEYNKRNELGAGNDPTQFLKSVNTDAVEQLTAAGLINDQIRGTTTSSARREVPSMVFGMSTPGPLDRRPGKPKVKVGAENAQTEIPASRLTGSSFVMDDGDSSMFRKGPAATTPSEYASIADGGDPTLPMNELVRIRTRTGHQILLHNTEDLVYISHGSGNSWIEMTANGKLDIYSKDSVSIHSDNDLNFDAGRNVNIKAGNNINIVATNQMSTQTGANWDVLVGADGRLTCAGTSNIASAGHYETATVIHMNGPVAPTASPPAVPTRIPSVEPWGSHENINPTTVNTEATATTAPLPAEEELVQMDTFAKCPPESRTGADTADPGVPTTPPTTVSTDAEVAAYNESIGGGEYSVDGRTVRPGTATITSTPSRTGPR